jgi:hypothetical protein
LKRKRKQKKADRNVAKKENEIKKAEIKNQEDLNKKKKEELEEAKKVEKERSKKQ